MRFWIVTTKLPYLLLVVALLAEIIPSVPRGAGTPFLLVGGFWLLLTASSRRAYWRTRLRSRAAHDEHRARSRPA